VGALFLDALNRPVLILQPFINFGFIWMNNLKIFFSAENN